MSNTLEQLILENQRLMSKVASLEEERDALIKAIDELQVERYLLKEELGKFKAYLFRAKRERNVLPSTDVQLKMFVEEFREEEQKAAAKAKAAAEKEKEAKKKKQPKKSRKGITRIPIPEYLERETIIIEPDGVDTSKLTKIGEDITETLAFRQAKLYVKRIVRPKYADKTDEDKGIKQANVPARIVPKGNIDDSFIIQMLIEKVQFHIPVHRFVRKIKEQHIDFVKENNTNNWFHKAAELLLPLYYLFMKTLLAQNYLQIDESPIQVINKNKKGASVKSYMWVFFAPQQNALVYHHDPTRSAGAIEEYVANFKGFIQADGYSVYESLNKKYPDFELTHCLAHARRKFFEAKESDPTEAQYFIDHCKALYAIERKAREDKMTPQERHALRQEKAVPILKKLKTWLTQKKEDPTIIPNSLIYKAINYTHKRWDGLSAYAHKGNGILEIDNNLVENSIRPLALGRRNYLFAGSNTAARNLAVLYSFVGTCLKRGINTTAYLNWLFQKVINQKITPDAINWLPHNVKPEMFNAYNTQQKEEQK